MFKFRAKRRFRLHYFEQLLKGEASEAAADAALTQTKAEMQAMVSADTELSDMAKQRLWYEALDDLVEWQALLIRIPIDRTELAKVAHQLIRMDSEALPDTLPEENSNAGSDQ